MPAETKRKTMNLHGGTLWILERWLDEMLAETENRATRRRTTVEPKATYTLTLDELSTILSGRRP